MVEHQLVVVLEIDPQLVGGELEEYAVLVLIVNQFGDDAHALDMPHELPLLHLGEVGLLLLILLDSAFELLDHYLVPLPRTYFLFLSG